MGGGVADVLVGRAVGKVGSVGSCPTERASPSVVELQPVSVAPAISAAHASARSVARFNPRTLSRYPRRYRCETRDRDGYEAVFIAAAWR